jgi:uncharacterized repeat protein (TIGR03843 family)
MLDVSTLGETASSPSSLSPRAVLSLLEGGDIHLEGRIAWSSNVTFLATLQRGAVEALAVYKPRRGERPLWDFAQGTLCLREVAAYQVSEALGWALVPPTVLRDGPYGLGSLQFFVAADPEENYFTFRDDLPEAVARLALFDAVTNNADRKAGHCLLDPQGHMWAIDNALTFHVEPKLRTVIWDLAGEPIPPRLVDELRRLDGALKQRHRLWTALRELLTEEEMAALSQRLRRLLRQPRFPEPRDQRSLPWPLI